MMRNVAIGAVVGFGAVVLLLSVLNNDAPPAAPPPAAVADGGGLMPLNVGPVILLPPQPGAGGPPVAGAPNTGQPMAVDNARRNAAVREALSQHREMQPAVDAPDAAVP